jgi:hypothetical protein
VMIEVDDGKLESHIACHSGQKIQHQHRIRPAGNGGSNTVSGAGKGTLSCFG